MAPSPMPPLSSTLQMLDAVATSNNHNRDLKFLCSGISLSYHQSILFINSTLLSSLMGSLACCKCENGQCGRKEEVVIVLDKVEVGTVQGLMEYLYKGECKVKDKRGFTEMQELVNMLGIQIQLELEDKNSSLIKVEESDASEPNLEETVTDLSLDIIVNELENEQTRIEQDIKKCIGLFGKSEVEQKCSKCDECLNKENFMEHYRLHKEEVQSSLRNIVLQKKLNNPLISRNDDGVKASEAVAHAKAEVESEINVLNMNCSENTNSAPNLEAEQIRLSSQVILCMERFDKGVKETPCTECGQVIVKEALIEHYKVHVDQINDKISEISSIKKIKKKPGPKSKTTPKPKVITKANKSRVAISEVEEDVDDPAETEFVTQVTLPMAIDIKEENIDEIANVSKSRVEGSVKKMDDPVSRLTREDGTKDEYTCFNPTFKIKPGTKKVGKSSKSSVMVPVPEIKLTFNLDDLGISQETIQLKDLSSSATKVSRKRKGQSGDLLKVVTNSKLSKEKETNGKKTETNESKKRKRTKASESILKKTRPDVMSTSRSNMEASESLLTSSNIQVHTTTTSPPIFSLPTSTSCSSFSSFLRTVCGKADSVLPPGLDSEQEGQGRRVVHKLAVQRVQNGEDCLVTKEDVMREMIVGIEEEEAINMSSDGSESALIMDLSDQDL
eukprot:GFUD01017275.1.p1 GENE.GFUD01017275.1~~GFUD01017275.1.p1  ORF type:complete len:690 (+),score=182.48 GFUD01017275.1:56-2071(+)